MQQIVKLLIDPFLKKKSRAIRQSLGRGQSGNGCSIMKLTTCQRSWKYDHIQYTMSPNWKNSDKRWLHAVNQKPRSRTMLAFSEWESLNPTMIACSISGAQFLRFVWVKQHQWPHCYYVLEMLGRDSAYLMPELCFISLLVATQWALHKIIACLINKLVLLRLYVVVLLGVQSTNWNFWRQLTLYSMLNFLLQLIWRLRKKAWMLL